MEVGPILAMQIFFPPNQSQIPKESNQQLVSEYLTKVV
jgi:hypothetical protein